MSVDIVEILMDWYHNNIMIIKLGNMDKSERVSCRIGSNRKKAAKMLISLCV